MAEKNGYMGIFLKSCFPELNSVVINHIIFLKYTAWNHLSAFVIGETLPK